MFTSLNNILSNNLSFSPFFYYAEMRRKLWPKAVAKEGARCKNNFSLLYTYKFFFKSNKKIHNRANKLYFDATIFLFWFFIVYLPKNNGNLKMAQGCGLSSITVPKDFNICLVKFVVCLVRGVLKAVKFFKTTWKFSKISINLASITELYCKPHCTNSCSARKSETIFITNIFSFIARRMWWESFEKISVIQHIDNCWPS